MDNFLYIGYSPAVKAALVLAPYFIERIIPGDPNCETAFNFLIAFSPFDLFKLICQLSKGVDKIYRLVSYLKDRNHSELMTLSFRLLNWWCVLEPARIDVLDSFGFDYLLEFLTEPVAHHFHLFLLSVIGNAANTEPCRHRLTDLGADARLMRFLVQHGLLFAPADDSNDEDVKDTLKLSDSGSGCLLRDGLLEAASFALAAVLGGKNAATLKYLHFVARAQHAGCHVTPTVLPCHVAPTTPAPLVADLVIREGPVEGLGLGHCVWDSGWYMARWILEHHGLLAGRRVLELGSGVGIVGLMAAAFARSVVLTDYVNSLVSLIKHNARLCRGSILRLRQSAGAPPPDPARSLSQQPVGVGEVPPSTSGETEDDVAGLPFVHARRLDWRYPDPVGTPFDVIVASDVVYEPACVGPLAHVIATHLAPEGHGFVLIATNRDVCLAPVNVSHGLLRTTQGIPEFEAALVANSMAFDFYTVGKTAPASPQSGVGAPSPAADGSVARLSAAGSRSADGSELMERLCELGDEQDLDALWEARQSANPRGIGFRMYHIFHDYLDPATRPPHGTQVPGSRHPRGHPN